MKTCGNGGAHLAGNVIRFDAVEAMDNYSVGVVEI